MNEFITLNPAVAIWLIGILAGIIVYLGYILLFFMRRSFDNLVAAISSLERTFAEEKKDMGVIKDRLQKVETTCEMQRNLCPQNGQKRIDTVPPIRSPG